MRKWIVVLVVIAAVGVSLYLWHAKRVRAAAASTVTVTTTVSRGSIFQSISSSGKVVSNLDVDIKCKASGEVVTLPFDVSQAVKKGDLLVQLDPIDEQREVHTAEVAVSESRARLEQTKQNLQVAIQQLATTKSRTEAAALYAEVRAKNARTKAERQKSLVSQQLGSAEELESAQTDAAQAESDLASAKVAVEDLKSQELQVEVKRQDVKLSEAALESDQINLSNAQQRLTETKVMAPMDGVVSAINVQKGTIISSAISNIGGGTAVMTLSDLSRIFVLATVDESDIGKVKADQSVLITVDAYPTKRFRGKVVRIATKGVNTSNVVTFEVKVEVLDDEKSLLKPEMTANVQIIQAERKDVLTVLSTAIGRNADGKMIVSTLNADGSKTDHPVTLGITDGEKWELIDGVNEGTAVAVKDDEAASKWKTDGKGGPPR